MYLKEIDSEHEKISLSPLVARKLTYIMFGSESPKIKKTNLCCDGHNLRYM
jgi:hypothetical protein